MRFIDSHCHLDFPPFYDTLAETVSLASAAGVDKLIAVSVTANRFERVLSLTHQSAGIYAALGLHPVWADQHQPGDLQLLSQHLEVMPAKLVAIGEIGLDAYTPALRESLPLQISYLHQQLDLAKAYQLPVILHSRATHDRLAKILRQQQLAGTGVIHGFSGSYQQGKQFIDLGYSIGVGGIISYDRANKTRSAIAKLPLENLILETDAPDMPLQGYQGKVNRPERLSEVFLYLCALRKETPDVICQQLWQNAVSVFPCINDKITQ